METRLVINLSPDERSALTHLAEEQLRSPRDQLSVILRQALQEYGWLTEAPKNTRIGISNMGLLKRERKYCYAIEKMREPDFISMSWTIRLDDHFYPKMPGFVFAQRVWLTKLVPS